MLTRILETEVMDLPEEARDYDAMDHSQVNRVFVMDFLAVWDGRQPILDVGTGTAQIPIELCRQSKTAQVVAVDLAEEMLRIGRDNVRRASLEDRVQLQRIDAKQMTFADGTFAAVISNSIIHHIPEPAHVLSEMVRVTASGGIVFVRDLLRPSDEATLASLVDTYAAEANSHQRQLFEASLHAALTLDEVRTRIIGLGFSPDTVQQTSDRHWTWQAQKI